eukprot:IDg12627t1
MPRITDELRKRVDALVQTVRAKASYDMRCTYAEQALFIARVAATLVSSREVEQAFHFEKSVGMECARDGVRGHCREYVEFCEKLQHVSSAAYALWASQVCTRLGDELRSDLETGLSGKTAASWQVAPEKAGGDEADQTHAVKWPRTASVGAVRFAVGACTASNRGGGLALARRAVLALTDEMRRVVLDS